MNIHNFPSKLLEETVNELANLPGVGYKSALRFALFLLNKNEADVEKFGNTIINFKKKIKHCTVCNNISDTERCDICQQTNRKHSVVCIVESIKDVMAIESTQQYQGVYHVLGGIISPIDGIGPSDLAIDLLEERVQEGKIKEIILALSTTMEGDTTNFYLYKKLSKYDLEITTIARGISFGDELEYADELTLGRSIINRVKFQMNNH